MSKFLIINGPNLNFLGKRDPEMYGTTTLMQIEEHIHKKAKELDVQVEFFQSNSEGDIIDLIQRVAGQMQGIIINPGALGAYAYGLKDALIDSGVTIIEVHLSNIYAREEWRRYSVITDIAKGQISGLGWRGYLAALEALAGLMEEDLK